jgi:uncharacterized radical SAM protein YgiQ
MDAVYELPYTRNWHPRYEANGGVPALSEVKFSLTSHRGCFGACAFCAIHFHQGRIIQARSQDSLVREAELLTRLPDFKGYIHDVGGPTANFRHPACADQAVRGACRDRQCLFPSPCPKLDTSHDDYLELLRKIRAVKGVKKVFVRSGIRYDYLMAGDNGMFLEELCAHHISGQLKVAPEHASQHVLDVMRKGRFELFRRFMAAYRAVNQRLGKKQFLVPYFLCSHPGCDLPEAAELALFAHELGFMPEQVQDFIPTPGSLATCMWFTGYDPFTGEKLFIPSPRDRLLQKALLQFRKPENAPLVHEALSRIHRQDLLPKLLPQPGGSKRKGSFPRKNKR